MGLCETSNFSIFTFSSEILHTFLQFLPHDGILKSHFTTLILNIKKPRMTLEFRTANYESSD